jgi:hypothetical protein
MVCPPYSGVFLITILFVLLFLVIFGFLNLKQPFEINTCTNRIRGDGFVVLRILLIAPHSEKLVRLFGGQKEFQVQNEALASCGISPFCSVTFFL